METTNKLYRVLIKTTGSLQPIGTYWDKDCIYCGRDLIKAKEIFYTNECNDYDKGYGNSAKQTILQVIVPGDNIEEIYNDTINEME